jgi:hypothetical protein
VRAGARRFPSKGLLVRDLRLCLVPPALVSSTLAGSSGLSRTHCHENYAVSLQSLYNAAADVLRPCLKILTRSFVNYSRQCLRNAKLHDLLLPIHDAICFRFSVCHARKLTLSALSNYTNPADVADYAEIVSSTPLTVPLESKIDVAQQRNGAKGQYRNS